MVRSKLMNQACAETKHVFLNNVKNISNTTTSLYLSNRSIRYPLQYDVAIVGGGIIGVAIGREITKQSKTIKCVLLEKENVLGKHQSSHNSGVVHSGIYYKPGSLKAQLCSKGIGLILDYCEENGIPYISYGKLIVAKDHTESDKLRRLYERGEMNNVPDIKMLWSKRDIQKIEPKCNGIEAMWSPRTSNVDWRLVTKSFATDFSRNKGDILLNNEVTSVNSSTDCDYPITVKTKANIRINSKYLIICGGLQSGVLANKVGDKTDKNTYLSLRVDYRLLDKHPISTNIYGIPDKEMPFLGAHISPRVDGSVLLGPAAVPAYGIEGHRGEFNFDYLKTVLNSIGFQNMTRKYFSTCLNQVRSAFCPTFQIEQLQELAKIRAEDVRSGPTAVQGVLIDKDGNFVDDFLFEFFKGRGISKRIINCKFLPSPAATCSMSIAELVAERFFKKYLR